jgi:hypothetical protein
MTDFIQKLAERFLRGIKLSNGTMYKYTLKNTERVTKHGRFRETGNKGYTRRRQTKQTFNYVWIYPFEWLFVYCHVLLSDGTRVLFTLFVFACV